MHDPAGHTTANIVTAAAISLQRCNPGVPAFLANVPVLGSALRGVVIRSAQRMIQDIESILSRVNDTTDIHEVLRRAAKKGHAQEADKQAQAQRKQQKAQQDTEQKQSNRGGRFL